MESLTQTTDIKIEGLYNRTPHDYLGFKEQQAKLRSSHIIKPPAKKVVKPIDLNQFRRNYK